MTEPRPAHHDLTRNQELVLSALAHARGPLSAYTILDRLRGDGFRAPLQVYRALKKLRDYGLVHRLESLNAFVACRRPGGQTRHAVAFAICEACGIVTEFADDTTMQRLGAWSSQHEFRISEATIELKGVCGSCAAN